MVIAVAAVVIFIYGMLASMLGTIVPGLGSSLRLTTLQLSYLALAQGIGLAATSVWAGALMDRQGCKAGIVAGLVASICGLALLSHPTSLALGIVAMLFLGVGGSLVIVGANALVNAASTGNRASALNILNLFVGLGGMSTPLVAGNLLHSDPEQVAYAAMAMAAVALAATLAVAMPRPPRHGAVVAPGSRVFGNTALYILSAVTFLYTACEFALWNWLPKLLIARAVPEVTALNLLSLGFAGGMLVGRFGAARLLARAAPLPVVLGCAVAMAVTTFAILQVRSIAALAVLVFVTGLAMAPVFPTTIAIVGNIFRQRSGTAIGFAITCGFSGLVVSSPVIGLLAGSSGQDIAGALLLLPALSLLIAAILVVARGRLGTPAA